MFHINFEDRIKQAREARNKVLVRVGLKGEVKEPIPAPIPVREAPQVVNNIIVNDYRFGDMIIARGVRQVPPLPRHPAGHVPIGVMGEFPVQVDWKWEVINYIEPEPDITGLTREDFL